MRKLLLAAIAAAGLLSAGAGMAPAAHAAVRRCWWTGPVRHCNIYHPGWRYHTAWWWRHHHWAWWQHPHPWRWYRY